jgi:hypothetical protein
MKSAIADPGNAKFVEIADKVKKGKPALLTHGGKFYVLASVDEPDVEELALCRSRKFRRIIEQSRTSARAGKGISAAEVRRKLGIK